jgi:hypothetical protein
MVHNRNNLKKGKEFSIALYYDGCGLQCRVSTLLDKQSVGLYIDGESCLIVIKSGVLRRKRFSTSSGCRSSHLAKSLPSSIKTSSCTFGISHSRRPDFYLMHLHFGVTFLVYNVFPYQIVVSRVINELVFPLVLFYPLDILKKRGQSQ